MEALITFDDFSILKLTKNLANNYSKEILKSLDQIPLVENHTLDELLAEKKGDRILHHKWEHSLLAIDKNKKFAGIIVGYEREKEDNNQYPENSIYVSDFAVSQEHQKKGLGRFLIATWLEYNRNKGFLHLKGNLKFSLQTNSADFNHHVQKLYEFFGFQKAGSKKYDNRLDNIYFLSGI